MHVFDCSNDKLLYTVTAQGYTEEVVVHHVSLLGEAAGQYHYPSKA